MALGTYPGADWGYLCFAEPYVSFMQCQFLSLLFALYVNSEYCSSWNCQLLGIGSPLRMLFGRHSELVLTGCCVRGLIRNGQWLPNSPSAQTQQPFPCPFSHRPWSSLRKAFALNSGWLLMLPLSHRVYAES